MKKLVYASKRRGAATRAALEAVLARSREMNRAEGITGMLLHDDRRFVQLLEGGHDPLARCFLRIAQSPLHGEVEIGVFADSPVRLFTGWDMAVAETGRVGVSLSTFWRRLTAAPAAERLAEAERFFMEQQAR